MRGGAWRLLALHLAAALFALSLGPQRALADADRSAFSAGPAGTRAFVELLRAEGFDVRLWDRPLWEDASREAGLIVLLAPADPLEPEEVAALLGHVRRGGRLLYAIGAGGGDIVPESIPLFAAVGLEAVPLRDAQAEAVAVVPIPGGAVPEGQAVFAGGARLAWVGERPATAHVLAEDARGLVAVAVQAGDGVFVAVADSAPFTNAHLAEGASAGFGVGLVASLAGQRPVILDTYHHGVRGSSSLWALLLASPWRWALVQGLVLLGLSVLAYGRRSEPVAPAPARLLPGAEAAAGLLAEVYASSGADALAAQALMRAFRRRVLAKLGAAPELDDEALLQAACARCGAEPRDLLLALKQAQQPGGAEAAAYLDKRLNTLMRRIDDVAATGG